MNIYDMREILNLEVRKTTNNKYYVNYISNDEKKTSVEGLWIEKRISKKAYDKICEIIGVQDDKDDDDYYGDRLESPQ